ncbi:hypothetical protein GNIT_0379 [Glaciecola nitratireducens FR1064]|uniref:Uncharacterized protein n=1 Tax=Glaciecola nitratireducens (strain JCM 12485 / KCTC 12276 / FR1064) TaxID=1085623 RepID=G4QJC7_GLANF|nr:hypothetical protein GNIT_0379 [Glaciecola nitratireducens FR1064]
MLADSSQVVVTDEFAAQLIPHPFYDERSAGNKKGANLER